MIIDPIVVFQQAVNFIVLMVLLHRLLYKPVRKFLDDRTAAIAADIDEAEKNRREAEKMRSELEERLAEGRREAKEYLDNAVRRSEQVHETLLAEAKKEAEQLKQRAQEDIRLEQQRAWAELKDEVVNLSFQIASKVVQDSLDEKSHERLIQDAVAGLDEKTLGERL